MRYSGYIPMNNQYPYEKQVAGYDIKVRFWVKPNPMINTYKRHVCPNAPPEEQDERLKDKEEDIYTRIVIESE